MDPFQPARPCNTRIGRESRPCASACFPNSHKGAFTSFNREPAASACTEGKLRLDCSRARRWLAVKRKLQRERVRRSFEQLSAKPSALLVIGNTRAYLISVRRLSETADIYLVSYVPRGIQQERGAGGRPKRVPEYKAVVPTSDALAVRWETQPSDPEATLADFEVDARKRVDLLHQWLGKLEHLIDSVRGWASDLGWSTRVIEKPTEDLEIGDYKVPALLMQEETTKALLEPVARSTPGSEGLVDLYLMPAYDDIASIYFEKNRWNVYYMVPGNPGISDIPQGAEKPLTKVSFRKALDEMKKHAQQGFRVAHED